MKKRVLHTDPDVTESMIELFSKIKLAVGLDSGHSNQSTLTKVSEVAET